MINNRWRDPYDTAENEAMDIATQISFHGDPGKTLQAPAEEQDINVIMQRFGVKDGSVLPYWPAPAAMFGDFSSMPNDPVAAAEILRQGQLAFAQLPADIRVRFQSGEHLYNWLNDPRNTDEARRIGLLKPLSVSTSTSSDKEPLVPTPSNPPTGEAK